jgi:hypothetical protein
MTVELFERLKFYLKDLAISRINIEASKFSVQKAEDLMKASMAWQNWDANKKLLSNLKTDTADLDQIVRELAIEIYEEFDDKKPADGIEIVMKTEFEIVDPTALLDYCIRDLKAALTVDVSAVKKIVLAMPEERRPDCVKISKVPVVRIASDLSAYLEE